MAEEEHSAIAIPVAIKEQAQAAESAAGQDSGQDSGQDRWDSVALLPTPVMVAVPIPGFRVRNVLALQQGCVLSSNWSGGRDLPLLAGGVRLAWVEFEVSNGDLSARITRFSGE
jgi:hypothetical protein